MHVNSPNIKAILGKLGIHWRTLNKKKGKFTFPAYFLSENGHVSAAQNIANKLMNILLTLDQIWHAQSILQIKLPSIHISIHPAPIPFCSNTPTPLIQSTLVISRMLGAKIRERELSGSPLSRASTLRPRLMNPTIADPHSGVYNAQTACWAIIDVLTFPGCLHTSTSHQRQITTINIMF